MLVRGFAVRRSLRLLHAHVTSVTEGFPKRIRAIEHYWEVPYCYRKVACLLQIILEFQMKSLHRCDFAAGCAMIATPSVVVLDEPTTGLDPVSRRGIWQTIAEAGDVEILNSEAGLDIDNMQQL